jgi:peptidoglycan/LPS O-acetylase OafA/YrhL
VLMPTCLDCFGLGGLMAYFFTFKKDTVFKNLTKGIYLFFSFLGLLLTFYFTRQFQLSSGETHNFGNVVLERFVDSVFCFFLIIKAVSGYSGIMKWFLENSIVSYFGRISYGLYLYHNFVYNFFHTPQTSIVLRVLHKIQRMIPTFTQNSFFELFYFFGITVFVATLSWFIIEKPVNNLKKYFTY